MKDLMAKRTIEIAKKSFQQKHLIIVSGQSKHDKELNSVDPER
jgi:hypothetical protein